MYLSVSRLRIDAALAPELVRAFRARAHLVEAFEGFAGVEVWQSARDPGEILMVSRWRDRECFKTYMRSAEHRISHDRIDPDLDAAIRLERLEHWEEYEVVAE